jgi:hypothetical protein
LCHFLRRVAGIKNMASLNETLNKRQISNKIFKAIHASPIV